MRNSTKVILSPINYTDRDSDEDTRKNVKNNKKVTCWIILFNYLIIFFSCVCSGRLYPHGTPHWEI